MIHQACHPSFSQEKVHWLENVDGDPHKLRTACGMYEWREREPCPIDPDRITLYAVTCPECLEAMADTPQVIGRTL